ncbi:MAG: EF-P lysine aminoacylase GenX [Pseudomonadales bacterium]|jgi:lysyl-tRNA synthetase class 2|nr:EF-P lysine aminoacylase GenX [Pseudomonadales bacterium]
MLAHDWRPTASLAALAARDDLNRLIRNFFQRRAVLEVETPLMSRGSGTDPQLAPIVARYGVGPGSVGEPRYLQTSPEFAMKRLLAAGSGPIYQLGKAFRDGESGPRHNPEFTLLEWYRPGFTLEQLMEEVAALVREALALAADPIARVSYAALFQREFGLDPHSAPLVHLQALVHARVDRQLDLGERDACLDVLYSALIEPTLLEPVFIYDYPATQAALAKTAPDAQGRLVARRFELVMGGLELANGYDELSDAAEQARRFEQDALTRARLGLPPLAADTRLVAALTQGLPACAGVALGVDRLLMLKLGTRHIDAVLAFPHARA